MEKTTKPATAPINVVLGAETIDLAATPIYQEVAKLKYYHSHPNALADVLEFLFLNISGYDGVHSTYELAMPWKNRGFGNVFSAVQDAIHHRKSRALYILALCIIHLRNKAANEVFPTPDTGLDRRHNPVYRAARLCLVMGHRRSDVAREIRDRMNRIEWYHHAGPGGLYSVGTWLCNDYSSWLLMVIMHALSMQDGLNLRHIADECAKAIESDTDTIERINLDELIRRMDSTPPAAPTPTGGPIRPTIVPETTGINPFMDVLTSALGEAKPIGIAAGYYPSLTTGGVSVTPVPPLVPRSPQPSQPTLTVSGPPAPTPIPIGATPCPAGSGHIGDRPIRLVSTIEESAPGTFSMCIRAHPDDMVVVAEQIAANPHGTTTKPTVPQVPPLPPRGTGPQPMPLQGDCSQYVKITIPTDVVQQAVSEQAPTTAEPDLKAEIAQLRRERDEQAVTIARLGTKLAAYRNETVAKIDQLRSETGGSPITRHVMEEVAKRTVQQALVPVHDTVSHNREEATAKAELLSKRVTALEEAQSQPDTQPIPAEVVGRAVIAATMLVVSDLASVERRVDTLERSAPQPTRDTATRIARVEANQAALRTCVDGLARQVASLVTDSTDKDLALSELRRRLAPEGQLDAGLLNSLRSLSLLVSQMTGQQ